MDTKRIRGLMGLCVRAGQAVFGEDGCMKLLRSGECGILLLDGEISVNVDRTELERIRQVDGVRSVEEELLNEPTAGAGTGAAPGASG